MPNGSMALYVGFCSLLAVVVGAGIYLARRWGGMSIPVALGALGSWMLLAGGLAYTGMLARWDLQPPPAMVLGVGGFVATILLGRSSWAGRLARSAPLFALVGFQSFRLPLELLMHRAYSDGIMPVQMSFEGRNFDIVTGLLAIVLGVWAVRGPVPPAVLWAFNLVGLTLLVNIVGVAIASMPVFAAFGEENLNVWITWLPFVWLPTVFVTFALLGHLILFRRLWIGNAAASGSRRSGVHD